MRIAHAVVRVGGLIRVHLRPTNSSVPVCRVLALGGSESALQPAVVRRALSTGHQAVDHRTALNQEGGQKLCPPHSISRQYCKSIVVRSSASTRTPESSTQAGCQCGCGIRTNSAKRRMHVESAFMIGWQRLRVRCLSPSLCACMTLNYDTRVVRWAREGLRGDSEARIGAGLRRTGRMRMSQS